MGISGAQTRAAQGLLGLLQKDVCTFLGVSRQALAVFEKSNKGISGDKIEQLQKFFEQQGVEFLDYDGVRMRPSGIYRILKGSEGFKEFIYDFLSTD